MNTFWRGRLSKGEKGKWANCGKRGSGSQREPPLLLLHVEWQSGFGYFPLFCPLLLLLRLLQLQSQSDAADRRVNPSLWLQSQ